MCQVKNNSLGNADSLLRFTSSGIKGQDSLKLAQICNLESDVECDLHSEDTNKADRREWEDMVNILSLQLFHPQQEIRINCANLARWSIWTHSQLTFVEFNQVCVGII